MHLESEAKKTLIQNISRMRARGGGQHTRDDLNLTRLSRCETVSLFLGYARLAFMVSRVEVSGGKANFVHEPLVPLFDLLKLINWVGNLEVSLPLTFMFLDVLL